MPELVVQDKARHLRPYWGTGGQPAEAGMGAGGAAEKGDNTYKFSKGSPVGEQGLLFSGLSDPTKSE